MRPEPPGFVKDFYDARQPRCCHTCDFYDEDGFCQHFKERPPERFDQQQNLCEKWMQIIPF